MIDRKIFFLSFIGSSTTTVLAIVALVVGIPRLKSRGLLLEVGDNESLLKAKPTLMTIIDLYTYYHYTLYRTHNSLTEEKLSRSKVSM